MGNISSLTGASCSALALAKQSGESVKQCHTEETRYRKSILISCI